MNKKLKRFTHIGVKVDHLFDKKRLEYMGQDGRGWDIIGYLVEWEHG